MRTKTEVATIIEGIGEVLFVKMVEAYSASAAPYDMEYTSNRRAKIDLACYLKKCGLTYNEWDRWCKDTEKRV